MNIEGNSPEQDMIFSLPAATETRQGQCLSELFEDQVVRAPEAVAVVCDGQAWNYAELNAKANQVAHYLRQQGLLPGSVVAVMAEHRRETLAALLGISKAGGTYVPIAVTGSPEQVARTWHDSQAKWLLAWEAAPPISFTPGQPGAEASRDIHVTSPRPQIKNLDALPLPDRSLVDYSRYNQYVGQGCFQKDISLVATRGCPYKCLYCHGVWPKTHVVRSAHNIFQEVLLHYQRGYRAFSFLDDCFNLDRRNSATFFELVIKNKLKIRIQFAGGLRGDILTFDYIDLMAEAGVVQMGLALETASPRLQRLIGKNLNIEKLRENIEYICERHPNIMLDLFTMFGFPTETEQESLMTLDFIRGIKWLHFPQISVLKIFPSTEMARFAIEHGVTRESIESSAHLAYHSPSDTLPFPKSFVREYQARFMMEYFLLPERLASVIPVQKRALTRSEILARYNHFLPGNLADYPEIMRLIERDGRFYSEEATPNLAPAFSTSPGAKVKPDLGSGLRIFLIDLTQSFNQETASQVDKMVEAPLGLMYLLTYLNQELGSKIQGKIVKSRIDFDSFEELDSLMDDWQPQVIGIRTLSLYKEFFHKTVQRIKQRWPDVPLITGGPYATIEYATVLKDRNVDVAVLGEGELTFAELVSKMLEWDGCLPEDEVLKQIAGLAFVPRSSLGATRGQRRVILMNSIQDELARQDSQNLPRLNQTQVAVYGIPFVKRGDQPWYGWVSQAKAVHWVTNEATDRPEVALWHPRDLDWLTGKLWETLLHAGQIVVSPARAGHGSDLDGLAPEETTATEIEERESAKTNRLRQGRALLENLLEDSDL